MMDSFDCAFSGKAVYHLHSCRLRAWLFVHRMLAVDRHDPYIQSGDQRHVRLTEGKRALPLLDYGKVDYSTGHQSLLIIHDVTRSETPDPPKLFQLNYYLHAAMEIYGIQGKGLLHTSDGKTHEVVYDKEQALDDIRELKELEGSSIPPQPVRIPLCKGCTNFEWCFS